MRDIYHLPFTDRFIQTIKRIGSQTKSKSKMIVTRRLNFLKVLTNISGSRWIPIQQPFTKILVAWGITAGEISYVERK